ncbi:MAG TPA: GAF domain-containing SpoIIE family protein phosphatase [Gemmatimonadaceae bacterium]|nr:GAF domain-containing SpoIIE family protein phosphatase [Gemmatimonadaceae bacterium]
MTDLGAVLAGFCQATGWHASVWSARPGAAPTLVEGTAPAPDGSTGWTPALGDGSGESAGTANGSVITTPIPGPRPLWLVLAPPADGAPAYPADRFLAFLLPVVSQYLQSGLEVEHAAAELAERYEEINLLYTITEILGRTVSLEEAAARILKEVSETVGARRGSILVHDRVTDTLQTVAALGVMASEVPPIAVEDDCSVSAHVFREQRACITGNDEGECEAERPYRRGTMLSVPIMWTAPTGAEPLGVVNLSDRSSGQPFTAGDQKLITAIATQIGTAIQNARLVRASLSQQRLVRELELAHDLQMRLLPRTEVVAPYAEVAARVAPAESVGGDFYNLFRLGPGRTGVMIGDVSNHGYRAALIMALAMSASAIHAQSTYDPGDMLGALFGTLREELSTTEMFISAFYAIIDRDRGALRYANTGHPHAFQVHAAGSLGRLAAMDPPLGMVDTPPSAQSRPWAANRDLLVLFTDGVSDARNRYGLRFGEERVLDTVVRLRDEPVSAIVDQVFADLAEHVGDAVQRDDAALIVLRS